jgi:hypothetical protein
MEKHITPNFIPLWISLIALPMLLTIAAHSSHCGSTKTSMGIEGWTVEAHECSSSTVRQISDQAGTE